jgi:hypothetical protein
MGADCVLCKVGAEWVMLLEGRRSSYDYVFTHRNMNFRSLHSKTLHINLTRKSLVGPRVVGPRTQRSTEHARVRRQRLQRLGWKGWKKKITWKSYAQVG